MKRPEKASLFSAGADHPAFARQTVRPHATVS